MVELFDSYILNIYSTSGEQLIAIRSSMKFVANAQGES